jgi:hypothetical protein
MACSGSRSLGRPVSFQSLRSHGLPCVGKALKRNPVLRCLIQANDKVGGDRCGRAILLHLPEG